MTTEDIFGRILSALEASGVPYMVTGSFASSYHGAPRSTRDIDIVIAPDEASLQRLLQSFPASRYYVSEEAALDAFRRKTQFNVIDFDTGWKIDFILRKNRPFSQTEFDRRMKVGIHASEAYLAKPEDVILAKLEWAAAGESERQIEDAARVLHAQQGQLDMPYLERWVKELALEREWSNAVAVSGRLGSGADG